MADAAPSLPPPQLLSDGHLLGQDQDGDLGQQAGAEAEDLEDLEDGEEAYLDYGDYPEGFEGLAGLAGAEMPGAAEALSGLSGLSAPLVLSPALRNRRKFSTPAALQHGDLLLGLGHAVPGVNARRRFSNVSDVVSRKLSSTIGWRGTPPHSQVMEIVNQGKALCGQYMRSRLKRAGLFDRRKIGLQRLRSAAALTLSTPAGAALREVFPELAALGQELERRHPKVYTGVARQASAAPIVSDKAAAAVLSSVGRELVKHDVTWGKVVSLYAVAGALGVDCVRQGHPEYLQALVAALGDILEEDVAPWIAVNGGWAALVQHCMPPDSQVPMALVAGLVCAVMVAVLGVLLVLRWFGKFALV